MERLKSWYTKWQQPLSKKTLTLIYSLLGLFLLSGLSQMKQAGYSPNELFIMMSLPYRENADKFSYSLAQYMAYWTQIKWDDPLSFVAGVTPYRYINYQQKVATGEIRGYFQEDESTQLTAQQHAEDKGYTPNLPTGTLWENLSAFSDPAYVYENYMTAAPKMEFGVDMISKWNFYELVTQPIYLKTENNGPKILIFHTHVREAYKDQGTVADVGEALKETLESQYGIEVLHVTDDFYESSNTSAYPSGNEYETMEPTIQKILDEYPSIEVVIDLHRDGVQGNVHLVTDIDGKSTARIMFVNALCLNRNMAGEVEEKVDLPNPYIGDNLAFSMQALLTMNDLYPGMSRRIYLNEWRYSTHMRPYSLLMEWGAQTNTFEEVMNAVGPVAEVLAKVLQKD